jgi:hypothetical protein
MAEAPATFRYSISEKIRDHAMTFPDTTEGSSCVNRAFKAGGKNFAFLGEKEDRCSLRLKLGDSIPDIEASADVDPDRWQVGSNGWVLLTFPPDDAPTTTDLEFWVTESFRLLAPKRIVARFDA